MSPLSHAMLSPTGLVIVSGCLLLAGSAGSMQTIQMLVDKWTAAYLAHGWPSILHTKFVSE